MNPQEPQWVIVLTQVVVRHGSQRAWQHHNPNPQNLASRRIEILCDGHERTGTIPQSGHH